MAGRFHPLVLHFPIVLIVLALVAEAARWKGWLKQSDAILTGVLAAAAITTLLSEMAGFFLNTSGECGGLLMDRHLLAGGIKGAAVLPASGFLLLMIRNRRCYQLNHASLHT